MSYFRFMNSTRISYSTTAMRCWSSIVTVTHLDFSEKLLFI